MQGRGGGGWTVPWGNEYDTISRDSIRASRNGKQTRGRILWRWRLPEDECERAVSPAPAASLRARLGHALIP